MCDVWFSTSDASQWWRQEKGGSVADKPRRFQKGRHLSSWEMRQGWCIGAYLGYHEGRRPHGINRWQKMNSRHCSTMSCHGISLLFLLNLSSLIFTFLCLSVSLFASPILSRLFLFLSCLSPFSPVCFVLLWLFVFAFISILFNYYSLDAYLFSCEAERCGLDEREGRTERSGGREQCNQDIWYEKNLFSCKNIET